ncbi:hypothetical protein B7494_g929 [Chlorociboria aeruginascens]|nr:hypothetical protein B7494_g929 [Chlorociboria aeruginascens]
MDTNALIDLVHEVQGQLWVDKVNEIYRTGRLCQWVSTFHPDKLPCQLDGMICDNYIDEKVAKELEALSLIYKKTKIPVPRIQAWGTAASNPLGLGPFIIMDFINGVSVSDLFSDLFKNSDSEHPTRLIREDISNSNIEAIYRQLANFLLQLFELDFDQIGSLPSPKAEAQSHTSTRPLTFKAYSILQNGGVNTFGDRSQGFTTTTEYFQYVVGQDWEQLVYQPNSVVGLYDAKNKYVAFKVLKDLVPDLVNTKYNRCKFKLICDGLGLANLIVRSKEDLTVVGVVDLEWSYIGPAQLIAARYFKYLEIFIHILEEEEAKMPGHKKRELSNLVKWSQTSGVMWLHLLLLSGFNNQRSFPFTQLRRHLGATECAKREKELDNTEELEAFAAQKVSELDKYDEAFEKREKDKVLVDSGKITKEEFIDNALTEPSCPPCSSSFVVNDKMR